MSSSIPAADAIEGSKEFWDIDYIRLIHDALGENHVLLKTHVYNKLLKNNKDDPTYDKTILTDDKIIESAISNNLISPQVYEIRRRIFDNQEGFKIWRELGMSISNTIKSLLVGKVWTRSIIEQGKNLGYAGIEAQCQAGMTKYPQLRTTCEYCGYTENDKKDKRTYDDKSDGREHAIFSCEHVLEVGLLWLFMGISFKSPKLDKYVKELYQSNYRMSCCRCNFIKADIQVNKSIVPESTTGEPTIFVGWNPVKKQFYVNMKAINEFARLVMCFSMRTTGASGKGHKHIIDHLSTLGTTVSEASVKIVKNTTICVKECVQRMNTLIFDSVDSIRDSDTDKQVIKKKRLFNPCVARLSAYSTVYDLIENKKDGEKGQKGGGTEKEIQTHAKAILSNISKEQGDRPPKLFDNSLQSVSDKYLNLKLRFMLTLDNLLEESLEYQIYRDFADFAAVSSEIKDQAGNENLSNLYEKYQDKMTNNIETTTDYVGQIFDHTNRIISNISDYQHEIKELEKIMIDISYIQNNDSLSNDEKKSLHIDIWNILNDYITRIYTIYDDIIRIGLIMSQSNEAAIKLLKVVRFCIGKGLCCILYNLAMYTGNLFIEECMIGDDYNNMSYIFYDVNTLTTTLGSETDMTLAVYSQYMCLEQINIKPIFNISINTTLSGSVDGFPIIISKVTPIKNGFSSDLYKTATTNINNDFTIKFYTPQQQGIVSQATTSVTSWFTKKVFGKKDDVVEDKPSEADILRYEESALSALKYAEDSAEEAKIDAINQDITLDEIKISNEHNSRLHRSGRSYNKTTKKFELAKPKKGGSNVVNNIITGISSIIRNEVKSKYKISKKRPNINKKTRKNLFSLLDKSKLKRKMQSMKLKPRKMRTRRKKQSKTIRK